MNVYYSCQYNGQAIENVKLQVNPSLKDFVYWLISESVYTKSLQINYVFSILLYAIDLLQKKNQQVTKIILNYLATTSWAPLNKCSLCHFLNYTNVIGIHLFIYYLLLDNLLNVILIS